MNVRNKCSIFLCAGVAAALLLSATGTRAVMRETPLNQRVTNTVAVLRNVYGAKLNYRDKLRMIRYNIDLTVTQLQTVMSLLEIETKKAKPSAMKLERYEDTVTTLLDQLGLIAPNEYPDNLKKVKAAIEAGKARLETLSVSEPAKAEAPTAAGNGTRPSAAASAKDVPEMAREMATALSNAGKDPNKAAEAVMSVMKGVDPQAVAAQFEESLKDPEAFARKLADATRGVDLSMLPKDIRDEITDSDKILKGIQDALQTKDAKGLAADVEGALVDLKKMSKKDLAGVFGFMAAADGGTPPAAMTEEVPAAGEGTSAMSVAEAGAAQEPSDEMKKAVADMDRMIASLTKKIEGFSPASRIDYEKIFKQRITELDAQLAYFDSLLTASVDEYRALFGHEPPVVISYREEIERLRPVVKTPGVVSLE